MPDAADSASRPAPQLVGRTLLLVDGTLLGGILLDLDGILLDLGGILLVLFDRLRKGPLLSGEALLQAPERIAAAAIRPTNRIPLIAPDPLHLGTAPWELRRAMSYSVVVPVHAVAERDDHGRLRRRGSGQATEDLRHEDFVASNHNAGDYLFTALLVEVQEHELIGLVVLIERDTRRNDLRQRPLAIHGQGPRLVLHIATVGPKMATDIYHGVHRHL